MYISCFLFQQPGTIGTVSSNRNSQAIRTWYFYFPIRAGGLEVHDPMVEMFCLRAGLKPEPARVYGKEMEMDERRYEEARERWENSAFVGYYAMREGFMSFEEYVAFPAVRMTRLGEWLVRYDAQLAVPAPLDVNSTPLVRAAVGGRGWMEKKWREMSYYEKWIVGVFGEEVVDMFGGLEIVDRTLIPVGMVGLFKSSRMRWEQ